ncbi:hypothetical protein L6R53_11990 [Myxococcota bacterium]|nr:hypothetical protein [Myxococcota bacterium]
MLHLLLSLALLPSLALAQDEAHAPPPEEAPPAPAEAPPAAAEEAPPATATVAPAPPAPAPPASHDYALALDVAQELRREGDRPAAHALSTWIAAQPDAEAFSAPATDLATRSAPRAVDTWPKVRLIGFQAAAGATVLGAGPALLELFDDAGGLYFATALVGGAAGTVGGIALARHDDFHTGRVHALVATQELVTFNLVAAGALAEDEHVTGAALLGGAALGTGLGAAWALSDPDPVRTLGLHSGAFWGFGLTTCAMAYTYSFDRLEDRVPLVMAGGADLGAGLGYALTSVLPVSAQQVRGVNAGGAIGAGAAYGFAAMTSRLIWYTPHSVAAIVGGAGLAGGVVGGVLATRFDGAGGLPVSTALLSTQGRRVHLSVPVPRSFPVPGEPDAVAWGLDLVNQPL